MTKGITPTAINQLAQERCVFTAEFIAQGGELGHGGRTKADANGWAKGWSPAEVEGESLSHLIPQR